MLIVKNPDMCVITEIANNIIRVIKLGSRITNTEAEVMTNRYIFRALDLVNVFEITREVPVMAPQIQRGVSALVVEDNLINQRLIKLLLKEYGINVIAVSNGDEAVETCREHTFDIVFMDIDMPIKDGILATQEIKAEEGPTRVGRMPIIALTALAMEGDREYILGRGLDDYLSKPLTREKLEYVLHKYIHVKV